VRHNIAFSALLLSFLTIAAPGQQEPASGTSPTIKTNVDEVLVDIIARDKKGKPLFDVKPGDVTVTDNGMKQKLTSFRLVQGAEAVSSDGARTALDALHQIRLVTLAFEAMGGGDQRQVARKAAIDLIKGQQGTNVFYSVVMIASQLHLLQAFTRDRDALQKAIELATSGMASTQFNAESDRAKKQLQERLQQMTGQPDVALALRTLDSNPEPPRGSPALGSQALDAKMVEIMLDMTRFDAAVTDGTRLSLSALQSLVSGMSQLPGRKSILYFTWGLRVPPNLDDQFKSLTSMANRANVTFYTVDTNGVMTYSQNGEGANSLQQAARASRQNATQSGAVSVDMIRASDTAENSMRANNQSELRNLADTTGGFMVSDSNDLRVPLRRINEEIGSYYEISYNPGIQNYDGSFRRIKVEASRKDLVVQARNGYFALPVELRQSGMMPFEPPLLSALASTAPPHDIGIRSRLVRFQPTAKGVTTSVVVEVPVANLEFKEDQSKHIFNARLSLVALVKDGNGSVQQKFTRDVPIQATPENLAGVRLGNFVYKDMLTLPAGKYTLDTAVMDRGNNKIGTDRVAYELAAPKNVGISSITLIRSYAAGAKDLEPTDPFQYQGGRVTPTLTPTLKGGKGATLSMFFVVYPETGIADKPAVEIEYIRDGQVVGKGGLELPAADTNGRIPYIMSSSAESLPAGEYVIRATVKQGASTTQERATFKVEN
jgi:VWFA-related protein